MKIDQILKALLQGDKTAGDLLDAGGYKSYTELNADLLLLKAEGKIVSEYHPHGYRLYKLAQQKPRSALPWQKSD